MPMEAELPTVTTVRIKALMTGALSSFFETKEDFASEKIPEDSVLHQAKNFLEYIKLGKRVIFSGDHIWMDMFNHYFDKEWHYSSHNIRDLDTVDQSVTADIFEVLEKSKTDLEYKYNLFVCHLLGIDHAGHTFHANHTEIQRKLLETEKVIEDIINALDNDTILLLYGDHGMTNDGNHGGGSQNEVKTVIFGYSKSGLQMLKNKDARLKI
jgi:phosphatidylinositol glycan class O